MKASRIIIIVLSIIIVLVTIQSARAAVLTQDNASRTELNLTNHGTGPANFTLWFDAPANSTFDNSYIGSVRGLPLEVVSVRDAYVLNLSGFHDAVRGDEELKISYTQDTAARRAYVAINWSRDLDLAAYDQVLLALPFQTPGTTQPLGLFNTSIHEVYDYNSWSESTLTWNNQPCGTALEVSNTSACNRTATDKVAYEYVEIGNYTCGAYALVFNITEVAKRRANNVSFLVRVDHNESFTGILSQVNFCSKETGVGVQRQNEYPTTPHLRFDNLPNPLNVTYYWNNTFVNATTATLNRTNNYNQTINGTHAETLSINHLLSPIPLIIKLWGPGVLELKQFQIVHFPQGLISIIQFNETPALIATGTSSGTFTKQFTINNTGTADAYNCTLTTTVIGGEDLAPYMSFQSGFLVVNHSSTSINVSVVKPGAGAYSNNINAQCSNPEQPSIITSSPVQFLFSINNPSGPSSGGGGGTTVVVSNETLTLTPRLADQFFIVFPDSTKVWELEVVPSIKVSSCSATNDFVCEVSQNGDRLLIRKEVPPTSIGTDRFRGEVTVTSTTGEVAVIPVGLRAVYVPLPKDAAVPAVAVGVVGAFVILTRRGAKKNG